MINKIQTPHGLPPMAQLSECGRPSPHGYASESTMVRQGGVTLIGVFTWPFRLIGRVYAAIGSFLQNYVCCCFDRCGIGFFKLNWEKTKPIFANMYEAVFTSRGDIKDREKRFNSNYKKLSPAAKKRFREHLLLAHAKKEVGGDLATREKWLQGKDIPTEKYLKDLSNPVLKDAVESFQTEIREKTK
jgi:hypothetical protein